MIAETEAERSCYVRQPRRGADTLRLVHTRYAGGVTSSLVAPAARLFTEVPDGLRLIGGLGIWLLSGHAGRLTKDIDVVAGSQSSFDSATAALRDNGYQVSPMVASWRRATSAGLPSVDLALHPVVNPRSFEVMSLSDAYETMQTDAGPVHVATATDLVRLKLLARRERDFVDVLQLVATDRVIDVDAVISFVEQDDCERSLSEGCLLAASALRRGDLARDYENLVGRPATSEQLGSFAALLRRIEEKS
jgi:hypothetical protein